MVLFLYESNEVVLSTRNIARVCVRFVTETRVYFSLIGNESQFFDTWETVYACVEVFCVTGMKILY